MRLNWLKFEYLTFTLPCYLVCLYEFNEAKPQEMAADVTLKELQSQLESKNGPFERVFGLLSVVQLIWTPCGECCPLALCPIPGRAQRPSSRTKCSQKSWSHQPPRSPESWCGYGHCSSSWGGSRRGGRQQLLLLAAVTNGHLPCMVASECLIYGLIKGSVRHVGAAHVVEALPSICRMLYS